VYRTFLAGCRKEMNGEMWVQGSFYLANVQIYLHALDRNKMGIGMGTNAMIPSLCLICATLEEDCSFYDVVS